MNPCELSMSVAALANAIACQLSDEDMELASAIFTQLADTLTTILVQRTRCEKFCKENSEKEKSDDESQSE